MGFGRWKALWNLVGFLAGYIEKMKTVRFKNNGIKMDGINE
jgi:hypothetical protein